MKNYYEILEVDKNASSEVIEKAYKTLAKKYHPDLQQGAQKVEAAEKMKIINQAYDVLSDNAKRAQYNQKLEEQKAEEDRRRAEAIVRQQQGSAVQQNYVPKQQVDEGTILNMSRMLQQQMRAARNQEYHDAYMQNLNRKLHKHDLKYYLKIIKILAIIIVVCFLIYQLPFVKNFFTNLYEENVIFQVIVNIFKNTFSISL